MEHHRKSDVADLLRHVPPDPLPRVARPVDLVDAAVVLLIEPVGIRRMDPDAMRIVAELGILDGKEVGRHALVQRFPIGAAVGAFKKTAG